MNLYYEQRIKHETFNKFDGNKFEVEVRKFIIIKKI